MPAIETRGSAHGVIMRCLMAAALGLTLGGGAGAAAEPGPPPPPAKVLPASPSPPPAPPTSSASSRSEATTGSKPCKTDADCTLVPADCCGCSQGGSARAIATRHAAAYERARRKRCDGTMCAEVMSQHPSCSARARCDAGTCRLAAPEPANPSQTPPAPPARPGSP